MLNTQLNTSTGMLIIIYPRYTRRPVRRVRVRSYHEAGHVLKNHTLRFICKELTSFLRMREYAYTVSDSLYEDRERAIHHLRRIIATYGQGRAAQLYKQLANALVSFAVLMPLRPSPAKTHFDKRIVPIIKHCQQQYQQFK